MDFQKDDLIADGFQGFHKIKDIRENNVLLPRSKGVYIVYRESLGKPNFREEGTGGLYQGKDPNVTEDTLWKNWIDNANILYIGQTGGSLRNRIRLYMRFGNGKPVAHWGGRLIWQLSDSENLLIAYKELSDDSPREVEKYLLYKFMARYADRLPFANLQR